MFIPHGTVTETKEVPAGTAGHRIKYPDYRGEGYCEVCGKFICDHCEALEKYEGNSIVGFIFTLVHFIIHLIHRINYHT